MIRRSPSIVPSITGRAVAMACFAGLLAVFFAPLIDASERASGPRAEFVKANPCPPTGKHSGPCTSHAVDPVTLSAAAGSDTRTTRSRKPGPTPQ